jgi:hypothetical protein
METRLMALLDVAFELGDHRLGRGEIPGGQHHEGAFPLDTEGEHLGVGTQVIDAGIGARVRCKHQAFIDGDGKTIGHGLNLYYPGVACLLTMVESRRERRQLQFIIACITR